MPKSKCYRSVCGCLADENGFAFCELHGNAVRMRALLNVIRKYFVSRPELGGEESPFVKKIDELLPRKG